MRDQDLWAGAVTKTRNRGSLEATAAARGLMTVEVGFTGLTSQERIPADAGTSSLRTIGN
jgi:hypothetical protein